MADSEKKGDLVEGAKCPDGKKIRSEKRNITERREDGSCRKEIGMGGCIGKGVSEQQGYVRALVMIRVIKPEREQGRVWVELH